MIKINFNGEVLETDTDKISIDVKNGDSIFKNFLDEKNLVSFGNYLFQRYGVMEYSVDGKNTPLFDRQVSNGDIKNWQLDNCDRIEINNFPAKFKHGDEVKISFMPDYVAHVTGVHFYLGKVKYDLEIKITKDSSTRIYNMDSDFVNSF